MGGCEDGHDRAAYQRREWTCRLLTRTSPSADPCLSIHACEHVGAFGFMMMAILMEFAEKDNGFTVAWRYVVRETSIDQLE